MKLVSIIVPTWNNEDVIEGCLKTLKQQTYKNIEVIVVDNFSKDKTIEIAKKYKARIKKSKSNISKARNEAAKMSKGEILIFTDSDCEFPKDYVKKIVKKMEKYDIVGGRDITVPFDKKHLTIFEKTSALIEDLKKPKTTMQVIHRVKACNLAITRKAFLAVKGFDNKQVALEEPDLTYRAYKKGFKLTFDPKIFVYHKRRTNLKSLYKQMKRNGQGKGTLVKKHGRKLMKKIDYLVITFPLITILLWLLSFVNLFFLWLWIFYLALYLFGQPLIVSLKTNKKEVVYLPLIQLIRLIAFEIGFWRGFLK